MYFDVSIGKIETSKPFISISLNLVVLLLLMPRFQILHFPGPEMARLLKKCKQTFGILRKLKFKKIDNNSSQNFLSYLKKVIKFCQIKTGQNLNFHSKI